MTHRALLFAACIVAFFTTLQAATVTLSPGATTKLAAGNTYQATADGTYTLTTNGTPVNTTIKVTANVTLILDNCHIASTTNYPLWLSENNKTLTILFKQSNQIIANSSPHLSPPFTQPPPIPHLSSQKPPVHRMPLSSFVVLSPITMRIPPLILPQTQAPLSCAVATSPSPPQPEPLAPPHSSLLSSQQARLNFMVAL